MNKPSSTAMAAGIAPFIAATALTLVKIFLPDIYAQLPSNYEGHLISMIAFYFAWRQKENTYQMSERK